MKPLERARPVAASGGRLSRARQHVRPEHLALGGLVLLGLVLRVRYAYGNYSILWPDEIHQSVEQAHRLVYDYGLIPWEFDRGVRSWAWPAMLAGLLQLANVLGMDDPGQYTDVIRGGLVLASACVAPAVYLLARAFGAERVPALVGAALVALSSPFVYFGHRAFAEAASLLPLTLGFALAVGAVDRWRDHPRARELFWAGALLLGFSVHLRLQNALFCIGLLVVLAWKREWRASLHACIAFGIAVLVLAIVDLAIWGDPTHATREYLEFWLGGEGAAHWVIRPFEWYVTKMWDIAPLVTVVLGVGAALGIRRAPSLFVVTAGSLLFLSLIGNKELRYLLPTLPFLCALAAVGFTGMASRAGPRVAVACAAVLAALAFVSGLRTSNLPEYYSDVNSVLMDAGRQTDICGLFVEPIDLPWTGGYYLFHRDVPIYGADNAPASPSYYNYAVRDTGGGATLVKTGDSCEADPNFTYALDEPPGG